MISPICKGVNKISNECKAKRELSSTEAEELWEKISDLSTILSKYKMVLYKPGNCI
jgi:hypothetical protein